MPAVTLSTPDMLDSAPSRRRFAIGVDVGGTFTDLVLADLGDGGLHRLKTPTTAGDPSRGVLAGVVALADQVGISVGEIGHVVHATTLVTNAIIERKGAPTGLITTRGMRDALEIGRESRYDLYDLYLDKPAPLVPRHLRLEVVERLRSDGAVHVALDIASVDRAARFLIDQGVRSVAVCLVNSYRNPVHETAIGEHLARHYADLDVSISNEVSRELGEYERTSTTVANAYVRPMVRSYLERLARELNGLGFAGDIEIMLSDGGVCSLETAVELPVRLIESGPAAGVRAACFMAGQLALQQLLSFDMGGTTAKIAFVDGGTPAMSPTFEAARVDRARQGSGLPLQIPTIELLEIGAGGGSIAAIDRLGILKVGPESAGAEPGPVSYGRGGSEPTVTDADLLLGGLSPAVFGFGTISLEAGAAAEAMSRLGQPMGMSGTQITAGIANLVNENMTNATRLYAAERARDPRGYTMVAYGGAGPVHAYDLARALGISRIIYPWGAGTLSAFGLLMSPRSMTVSLSRQFALAGSRSEDIARIIADLEDECYAKLATTGVERFDCVSRASVTMRYTGQGHELQVQLANDMRRERLSECAIRAEFERVYTAVFGRALDGLPVEFVNWYLNMTAPSAMSRVVIRDATVSHRASEIDRRDVFFTECGGFVPASILVWERMRPGETVRGPAVFESEDSTVVLGPRARVRVDSFRNLIAEIGEADNTERRRREPECIAGDDHDG